MNSRHEARAPSNQTAMDAFGDVWTTDLSGPCGVSGSGLHDLFSDPRIGIAASALGRGGRLDEYKVLELGSLEGAHCYCLEQLGAASVVGIEPDTGAFLRSLIVKEMLGLRARFLCGSLTKFLRGSDDYYDLIVCSGALYLQQDPLELIKQICLHSDRCYIWTHYQSLDRGHYNLIPSSRCIGKNGFNTDAYPGISGESDLNEDRWRHVLLQRDEITRAFMHFGLRHSVVLGDDAHCEAGANFHCAYSRRDDDGFGVEL